jgi:hypothetical protein
MGSVTRLPMKTAIETNEGVKTDAWLIWINVPDDSGCRVFSRGWRLSPPNMSRHPKEPRTPPAGVSFLPDRISLWCWLDDQPTRYRYSYAKGSGDLFLTGLCGWMGSGTNPRTLGCATLWSHDGSAVGGTDNADRDDRPGQAHGNEGLRHWSRIAMSPVPASAIVIVDDGIIIDAEVLAPKLGLSAEALRMHLQVVAKQRVPITYQEAVNAVRLTAPNTIHQVTDALEHLMAEDAASGRPFIAAIVISKARGGLPAPGFFDCAARLGRFVGDATGPEAWGFHAAEFNAAVGFWATPATIGNNK